MIPVKIQCNCGQRYAFDIEPVCGRMPGRVTCPVCGLDGTRVANEIIAYTLSTELSRHNLSRESVMICAVIGCLLAGVAGITTQIDAIPAQVSWDPSIGALLSIAGCVACAVAAIVMLRTRTPAPGETR